MAKYDGQIGDLKSKLAGASSILIALPSQITEDKLAGGLALFLSLEQLGKQVGIVSEGAVLVSHTNLYGVGKVKNTLPQVGGGGNFTLTLEGVVASDGTVPSLEKLDWFPEGANLNLVFHVLPGQKFQPSQIVPKYQTTASSSSLVFVLGAASLSDLGGIYTNNPGAFSASMIVNIDNNSANANFGQLNVVDSSASISEMVAQVINGLGLNINGDIASNVLTGIYSATNNLTANVNPDTFMVVGQAMQAGGKIPSNTPAAQPVANPATPAQPQMDFQQFMQTAPQAQPIATPVQTIQPQPNTVPVQPIVNVSVNTPVAEPAPMNPSPVQNSLSSNPFMAAPPNIVGDPNQPADTTQPSPDWLTPKVYKGTSLG